MSECVLLFGTAKECRVQAAVDRTERECITRERGKAARPDRRCAGRLLRMSAADGTATRVHGHLLLQVVKDGRLHALTGLFVGRPATQCAAAVRRAAPGRGGSGQLPGGLARLHDFQRFAGAWAAAPGPRPIGVGGRRPCRRLVGTGVGPGSEQSDSTRAKAGRRRGESGGQRTKSEYIQCAGRRHVSPSAMPSCGPVWQGEAAAGTPTHQCLCYTAGNGERSGVRKRTGAGQPGACQTRPAAWAKAAYPRMLKSAIPCAERRQCWSEGSAAKVVLAVCSEFMEFTRAV